MSNRRGFFKVLAAAGAVLVLPLTAEPAVGSYAFMKKHDLPRSWGTPTLFKGGRLEGQWRVTAGKLGDTFHIPKQPWKHGMQYGAEENDSYLIAQRNEAPGAAWFVAELET